MTLRQKIESILSQIRELEEHPSPDRKLPQNTYYLGERDIVCYPRENGESRYPYDADGLVVWARSSGYIEACESTFNIFQTVHFSEDPSVNFFAGIPMDSGDFYPLSLLGASRQLFEPLAVDRYVVYSPRCAYYITDTEQVTFAVRLHTDKTKHIHFAVTAINKTKETVPFYLASYHYAILKFEETEAFWDRMNKFGFRLSENSSLLRTGDHCLLINTRSDGGTVTDAYYTVAKSDFLGYKGRGMTNADSLRTGVFQKQAKAATTTEIPAACDMIHMELAEGEMVRREYDLSYYHNIAEAKSHAGDSIDTAAIDAALLAWEEEECRDLDRMKITFADWRGNTDLHPAVLNRFMRNVQKQTSFCRPRKELRRSSYRHPRRIPTAGRLSNLAANPQPGKDCSGTQLYSGRRPSASPVFCTCHAGYTAGHGHAGIYRPGSMDYLHNLHIPLLHGRLFHFG